MKKEEPKKPEVKVKEADKSPTKEPEIKDERAKYVNVDESPLKKEIGGYASPLPKNSHVMAEHYAKEFIMFEKEFLGLKEYSKEIPTDRRAEKHPTLLKYYGLYLQYADKR